MEALLEREADVESWNDERLDELSRRMDAGFAEMATKVELTGLKNEMNLRFDEIDRRFDGANGRFREVDKRFDKVDSRFDKIDTQLLRINDRLDRQNHTLLIGTLGVIAALLANGIFG